MGWSSGTRLFDDVCSALLDNDEPVTKQQMILVLACCMEDADWDTHSDSEYWDHPVVQEVMRELHPDWFDDEEEET